MSEDRKLGGVGWWGHGSERIKSVNLVRVFDDHLRSASPHEYKENFPRGLPGGLERISWRLSHCFWAFVIKTGENWKKSNYCRKLLACVTQQSSFPQRWFSNLCNKRGWVLLYVDTTFLTVWTGNGYNMLVEFLSQLCPLYAKRQQNQIASLNTGFWHSSPSRFVMFRLGSLQKGL